MRSEESELLAEILIKSGFDLSIYGIDVKQLAVGRINLSYEEMQYVLQDKHETRSLTLSLNLKEELRTSELKKYKFFLFIKIRNLQEWKKKGCTKKQWLMIRKCLYLTQKFWL